MANTFYNCTSLVDLDLTSFNTKQVTDMNYMFANCINLKTLNLESFSTENCFQFTSTFEDCKQLTVTLKSNKCQNLMGKIPEYVKINDKA